MNNLYPQFPSELSKTYTIDGKEVLKPQLPKEGTSGTEVFSDAKRDLTPQLPPNVLPL